MILTFPYHDPTGKYNEIFQKNFDTLKKLFNRVCLSATPLTSENNLNFVNILQKEGFIVYQNNKESNIGDHFRNALKIAIDYSAGDEGIFFVFIDRILFALESNWREKFLRDLEKKDKENFLIFERSDLAWNTHPQNYKSIENMISNLFQMLWGKYLELNPCAIIINPNVAKKILSQSVNKTWAVWGEWILLIINNKVLIKTQKVDWLSWEDPFWEEINSEELKTEREKSEEETIKRIKSNLPFLSLLTEERFLNLYKKI